MFNFFKQAICHPLETGAWAPTGNSIAELITDKADLKNAKVVVEFGCGNGVFTEKILKKIGPETFFFALEINPEFIEITKKRCPDVIIYNDNAINVLKYLKQNGFDNCDVIISGLPFAFFNKKSQEELLDKIFIALKPSGKFLTFSYLHGSYLPSGINFKNLLKKYFKIIWKSKTIFKNFPPAFIYFCTK